MTLLDIYYRAFKGYRKQTADNTGCEKDRRAIAEANVDEDRLQSTKYLCKIEEDWIKAIEEGLTFVEKAVAEERQFIRTNGEVVPIEKVRKISKDSVEHLAKHSDMITHVPEEEDDLLVPDKLYMVEKLSDYAVYENRFLYMMLSYVKAFIEYRLEKIENLRRKYVGDMSISKDIVTKKRTLRIKASVYEERTDNPFPIPDENSNKLVQRIKDCQSIINALLNTDLMLQVAKSPMIKPPIVKTNVLKMNNNFKHALALYDYIASYKGQGFDYEEVVFNFAPFTDKIADEIAEAANLTSFIAYKVGNDIESILEMEYEAEERRLKEEEEKKTLQRLKRLKKRALESNKTMEEYMLLLEERNRQLEKDGEELVSLRQEVVALNEKIDGINREKEELNRQVTLLTETLEEKEREIVELNQKYIEDMAAVKAEHVQEIAELNEAHDGEITELKAQFADELAQKIEEHETRVSELTDQIDGLNEQLRQTVAEFEEKGKELDRQLNDLDAAKQRVVDECQAKIKEVEEGFKKDVEKLERTQRIELKKARDENALIRGELDGIRAQQGKLTPSIDYTSRDRFIELEEEYMAYHRFFKSQWEFTKKEIRKTILWTKQEKKDKKRS
ncbi:MAG: hypothetical protein K2O89_01945 [Clostridia bacterium]|nr:hypothetical protein [Clostridia bacterium]